MKKTAYLLFGILIVMITMTACGKSEKEKKIIGTWRYEGVGTGYFHSPKTLDKMRTVYKELKQAASELLFAYDCLLV